MQTAAASGLEGQPVVRHQAEATFGESHGKALYGLDDVAGLSRRLPQELQAGRHVVEEVLDADDRAGRATLRLLRDQAPAFDVQTRADRLAGMARQHGYLRHRGDRGQGLAAEAERSDVLQIVGLGQLAGGMALERQQRVGGRNPLAVVDHPQQPPAALAHFHAHLICAGVQAVLNQLLDRGRGPLHHFTGGDTAGYLWGKNADRHIVILPYCGLNA